MPEMQKTFVHLLEIKIKEKVYQLFNYEMFESINNIPAFLCHLFFCLFQVQASGFKKNLLKISDVSKRQQVFKELKVCMRLIEEDKAISMLDELIC